LNEDSAARRRLDQQVIDRLIRLYGHVAEYNVRRQAERRRYGALGENHRCEIRRNILLECRSSRSRCAPAGSPRQSAARDAPV
jgi:hypothetical protein